MRDFGTGRAKSGIVRIAPMPSPLWLVTHEPLVNELVAYLDVMRRRIVAAPDEVHTFEFSHARPTSNRAIRFRAW